MFQLSKFPIEREAFNDSLQNEAAGALVTFEGWVRNHNQGKKVSLLEYEVYEALANKEGSKILKEALDRFNIHSISCIHRFGQLAIGEIAVLIGATASHRDDAFLATRFVIDEIKLRLPIWKKEHYEDQDAKWVFCKGHHTHVHFEEKDYYKKQERLTDQTRLKAARVLVVGAGGLGCSVLSALAGAGVGHVRVVDHDRVSISNLHRQPLYSQNSVGEKKVAVAKKRLSALNPFINVEAFDSRIDTTNVGEFVLGQTLVVDCTDNIESKFALHDACFKYRVPLVSASIYQYEGQIRTFQPGGIHGCLRCVYEGVPDDSKLGNCNDFGVLGSGVAAIGSIQANEAILFLTAGSNSTLKSTFFIDLKSLTQMKVKNLSREQCECCSGNIELSQNDFEIRASELENADYELIDIRNQTDVDLQQIKSGKKVVLYCHRGVRSKSVVQEMRARGIDNVYSLQGGACSL